MNVGFRDGGYAQSSAVRAVDVRLNIAIWVNDYRFAGALTGNKKARLRDIVVVESFEYQAGRPVVSVAVLLSGSHCNTIIAWPQNPRSGLIATS